MSKTRCAQVSAVFFSENELTFINTARIIQHEWKFKELKNKEITRPSKGVLGFFFVLFFGGGGVFFGGRGCLFGFFFNIRLGDLLESYNSQFKKKKGNVTVIRFSFPLNKDTLRPLP